MLANLKVLCGENAIDALKISEDSIFVLQESIKVLIDKNEIKKAANIIKKNWLKFQCMEIVEIFMTFKIKNISDSLNRYKIISRFLKKKIIFRMKPNLHLLILLIMHRFGGKVKPI